MVQIVLARGIEPAQPRQRRPGRQALRRRQNHHLHPQGIQRRPAQHAEAGLDRGLDRRRRWIERHDLAPHHRRALGVQFQRLGIGQDQLAKAAETGLGQGVQIRIQAPAGAFHGPSDIAGQLADAGQAHRRQAANARQPLRGGRARRRQTCQQGDQPGVSSGSGGLGGHCTCLELGQRISLAVQSSTIGVKK